LSITDILAAQIQSSISNGTLNASRQSYSASEYGYSMPNIPMRADQISSDMNSFDQWSFPHDKPKYYMNLNLAKYKRNSINAIGNLSSYSVLRLPMPDGLMDAHGVSWQAEALGWSGALTSEGIKALTQGNYTQGAVSTGVGLAMNVGELATGVTGRLGNMVRNVVRDNVGGAQAFIGAAPNKFLTVLFKGPQYRSLQFNWRLVPRDPSEAETIRTIVKNIKNAMSPTISNLSAQLGSLMFGYPDIVMMEFRPNAKYLYKFKPAVITAFSANYSPGGSNAFFHGTDATDGLGAPEGIDISMRTMELEYWLGPKDGGSGDGDFTDSNDTGDVYGGMYGVSNDGNGSKGLNSRKLGTVGSGGGLPERENQSNVLANTSYSNVWGQGGTNVQPNGAVPGQLTGLGRLFGFNQ
jgi:hypothetical protein